MEPLLEDTHTKPINDAKLWMTEADIGYEVLDQF